MSITAKDALIYIIGCEWGPGVSKIIFTLTSAVDQIKSDKASVTTNNTERKITSLYLSNDKGDKITTNSTHVTIELESIMDSRSNPFYYNLVTFQNEWASKYVVKSTFQVIHNGEAHEISFEKDCINNRTCPATEQFKVRDTYVGRYTNPMTKKLQDITLRYAAYEPGELKKDGVKNPLIIWIHGQGEGGQDVDIDLLGNPVTYLATEKIQSYFTTEKGAKGAYILAVQCETYWMDGGDGKNSNGDVISRYIDALMDTIKLYVSRNEDVDEKRIYIGGCSNGAFMTMSLLVTFPGYFAASYQTCCPYPFFMFKRDSVGNYIQIKGSKGPNDCEKTDVRWFTDEKANLLKDFPLWFVQSVDDPVVPASTFSFPVCRELYKVGSKNCWYSLFENVESAMFPGMKFFGHWCWIRLFNDQCTKVQDREKILKSDGINEYGFVPSNDGGGFKYASDEKGTYKSIFEWMNAQVRQ